MQSEAPEGDQSKHGIKGLIAKFDKNPKDDKHVSTYPHPLKKSGEKHVPIEHHQIHHVHHEVTTHQTHHHELNHPVQTPIIEKEQPALSVKDRIAQLQKQQSQTQNKTVQPKNNSGSKIPQSARHQSEIDLDKMVKDDSQHHHGRQKSMHLASEMNDKEPNFQDAVQNFLKVMTDEQIRNEATHQVSDLQSIQVQVLIQEEKNQNQQSSQETVLQNSEQSSDNLIPNQEINTQEEHHEEQQLQHDAPNEDNNTRIYSEIVQSQIIFVPKNEEVQQTSQDNKELEQSLMIESAGNPMLDSVPQDEQTEQKEESQPLMSSFIVSVQMQEGVFRISEQKVIQSIEKHNIDIEQELTDDNHHLWTVTDKNGKKTIYQGQIIDGVRTGHGREIQHDGTYYQGQYARNLPNGEGIIVYFDGDCYFGTFVDGQKQGVGTYISTDRETYQGEWYDDLQEGKGFQTMPDGSTYEGEFKHGKRNGRGTYNYNKTTYIGDFVDDKKHGQGEFIWSDGKRYKGGWENNLKHGFGVMIDINGNETPGEWIEGVRRKV